MVLDRPGHALGRPPRRHPGVVTYVRGGTQQIYAFEKGDNGNLYVDSWNGSAWHWADQGTPAGTTLTGNPGVITYLQGSTQRIYAFDRGANDNLYVNYWDGSVWHWADQGTPSGVPLAGDPGVVTYVQGGTQRIYAFENGDNGNLYVDSWNGSAWHWADQGTPAGTTLTGNPGVITYVQGGAQRIYAFDRGANGHLYVNYWDGSVWHWADQGTPV